MRAAYGYTRAVCFQCGRCVAPDLLHRRITKLGIPSYSRQISGVWRAQGNAFRGRPDQDGIATAKMALREFKEPLFLCGESLGSGVVAGIAATLEVPVKGLLLIMPFDSMTKVAQYLYWFFLAGWLLLDKFDNVPKLRDFQGHIAVLLAEQDKVIPNQRSMALFDSLSERKQLWRFKNAGHNNLPMEAWRPWWHEAMQFVDQ